MESCVVESLVKEKYIFKSFVFTEDFKQFVNKSRSEKRNRTRVKFIEKRKKLYEQIIEVAGAICQFVIDDAIRDSLSIAETEMMEMAGISGIDVQKKTIDDFKKQMKDVPLIDLECGYKSLKAIRDEDKVKRSKRDGLSQFVLDELDF